MLTYRYLSSVKNLNSIMDSIVKGTAPEKFNVEHLKGLGFRSSNDRAVIPLLKDLGFLGDDGTPTRRYHEYRDTSKSEIIMAEAIREAYQELFHISERPSKSDKKQVIGKFKSFHNVSDRVAELQAATFFTLLKLADLEGKIEPVQYTEKEVEDEEETPEVLEKSPVLKREYNYPPGLRYNIEIHLPSTKDIEVFNAIFKSLKEHLLE